MWDFPAGVTLQVQYIGFIHYGISNGYGGVIHNSKDKREVVEESLREFSDGREIQISDIRGACLITALDRAERYIGVPYNLFRENCEHFVRLAHSLEKESTQIQKYLITAGGIGIAITAEDERVQCAGVGAALGAVLTKSGKSPIWSSLFGAALGYGAAALVDKYSQPKKPSHSEQLNPPQPQPVVQGVQTLRVEDEFYHSALDVDEDEEKDTLYEWERRRLYS